MSETTRYHAREWAKGKSAAQIADRIDALRSAPRWQGVEFDDDRVRHMVQTEIETLTVILAVAERDAARRAWNAAAEAYNGGNDPDIFPPAPLDPTDVAVWES